MTDDVQSVALNYDTQPPLASSRFLKRIFSTRLIYLISIAATFFLWHVIATRYFDPAFFPGPLTVLKAGVELTVNGELVLHIYSSMKRIGAGFVIGSVIAIPVGLLMGSNKYIRAVLDPYAEFFRFVPAIAWLTPVVLWFGIGEISKVLIIIYTTVFIVLINTVVGVANISPNKLRAAACLGASPLKTFIYVIWPSTVPFVLTGMRLAMGNSFATVVSAEMIAADSGLGFLIYSSRLFMATDHIFVGIISLGALGMLADLVFRFLIKRFAYHYGAAV